MAMVVKMRGILSCSNLQFGRDMLIHTQAHTLTILSLYMVRCECSIVSDWDTPVVDRAGVPLVRWNPSF